MPDVSSFVAHSFSENKVKQRKRTKPKLEQTKTKLALKPGRLEIPFNVDSGIEWPQRLYSHSKNSSRMNRIGFRSSTWTNSRPNVIKTENHRNAPFSKAVWQTQGQLPQHQTTLTETDLLVGLCSGQEAEPDSTPFNSFSLWNKAKQRKLTKPKLEQTKPKLALKPGRLEIPFNVDSEMGRTQHLHSHSKNLVRNNKIDIRFARTPPLAKAWSILPHRHRDYFASTRTGNHIWTKTLSRPNNNSTLIPVAFRADD
jgi:hypothetical protein